MENSIVLDTFEAQILSLIYPVQYIVNGGQVVLFNADFSMAMPGGLLNGAVAMCALGGTLGGLIFLNQPFSMTKVMGVGIIAGLVTKLLKDVIFVLLVWLYQFTDVFYTVIMSPMTILVNYIIVYAFAFYVIKTVTPRLQS